DPVLRLEEGQVRKALNRLESQSLVRSVGDGRVTKFEHRLQEVFNFYRPEIAVLCELLLRGPQTPGELRTRASRLHAFEDLESVHSALQRLAKREPPLVTVLPRQAGTKEARYAHLAGETPPTDAAGLPTTVATAEKDDRQLSTSSNRQIESLTEEVARLRLEI